MFQSKWDGRQILGCYKEMIIVKGLKNGARKELMMTVASASFAMYRSSVTIKE